MQIVEGLVLPGRCNGVTMIKLVVNDLYQINMLDILLTNAKIDYTTCLLGEHPNGLKPPYLIVDGVPLDFDRSIKYIKEHEKYE